MDGEGEDEDQTEPEVGHGQTEIGDEGERPVDEGVLAQGGQHAEGEGDHFLDEIGAVTCLRSAAATRR
jgi:hypothetical protein